MNPCETAATETFIHLSNGKTDDAFKCLEALEKCYKFNIDEVNEMEEGGGSKYAFSSTGFDSVKNLNSILTSRVPFQARYKIFKSSLCHRQRGMFQTGKIDAFYFAATRAAPYDWYWNQIRKCDLNNGNQ